MQRNWKLLQEILMFLTLNEKAKVIDIGYCIKTGKCILVKDTNYQRYEKLNELWISNQRIDLAEVIEMRDSTKSIQWDNDLIDFHVDLLTEIKAIKIIVEDVEDIINKADWEYGCYQSANYDELIYDELDDYIPYKGIQKNIDHYQITWIGIELLNLLSKIEQDGLNLFSCTSSIPLITDFIKSVNFSRSRKKKQLTD